MGLDFESLTEATSGAVGGLLSTTFLYPLDTCKTKYQAEVRAGASRKYGYESIIFSLKFFVLCTVCFCRFKKGFICPPPHVSRGFSDVQRGGALLCFLGGITNQSIRSKYTHEGDGPGSLS
jgi:hypothetical protein